MTSSDSRRYTAVDVAVDLARGTVEYADPKVQADRLSICQAPCQKYNATLRVCKSCGCFLPGKVKFLKSSCPEGHW